MISKIITKCVLVILIISTILLMTCGKDAPTEPTTLCEISQTNLDFGDVRMSETKDLSFRIINLGESTLSGTVSLLSDEFRLQKGGGQYNLEPGQNKNIIVRYTPSDLGPDTCIVITGCSADVICVSKGLPAPPLCVVSPVSLPFGDLLIGESKELTFTISNDGGSPLLGTISETCNEFSILSGGGQYSLEPGQSKAVIVEYSPTNIGYDTCFDMTGCSSEVSITGYGYPEYPLCEISTTTLGFGEVCVDEGKDLCFTITNKGGGVLSGSVSSSSDNYSVTSSDSSYNLTTNQSKEFCVRFIPISVDTDIGTILTGCDSSVICTGFGKIKTITFSPAMDAHVYIDSPNRNYGGFYSLGIGHDDYMNCFISFDLSSIPYRAKIRSAVLRLYVFVSYQHDDELYRIIGVNQEWDESTVTWNNKPQWSSPSTTFIASPDAPQWLEIDVKNFVEFWVNDRNLNYGIELNLEWWDPASGGISIRSREADFNKPELVIDYCE